MGGPDAKRVDHFNRQSQWNAALSTGKSHITYKLPWCLLFSPPCMNSAVTIHPQSIYSNISLDIVHHFCQPNVLYTLRSASPLYDMMPVVLTHTHTTCDEGDASLRSTLIDIIPLTLVRPGPSEDEIRIGKIITKQVFIWCVSSQQKSEFNTCILCRT